MAILLGTAVRTGRDGGPRSRDLRLGPAAAEIPAQLTGTAGLTGISGREIALAVITRAAAQAAG